MLVSMAAFVQQVFRWLLLGDEILSELRSALIDRDSMSDDPSTAPGSVWKSAALHPRILECWDAVDCVEETKEANWLHWTAERFPESAHEFQKLMLLRLASGLAIRLFVR
jgi:hypothetical protein